MLHCPSAVVDLLYSQSCPFGCPGPWQVLKLAVTTDLTQCTAPAQLRASLLPTSSIQTNVQDLLPVGILTMMLCVNVL